MICEPQKDGVTLAARLQTGQFKRIIIPFWHGCGDVVMFQAPLRRLRELFPDVTIDVGLCKGLDQLNLIPDALEIEGNWRDTLQKDYDLVAQINFPLERIEDATKTKAEICCLEELGIEPVCGHLPIKPKRLVAVHFQCTSVPWVANADPEVAEKVWNDIKEAGFVPIETYFTHVFANPSNVRYPFVDTHVRDCAARLETLLAILGGCAAFVGTVGGNFHMALSVLGPKRTLLLERNLKAGHFTKEAIKTANLLDYKNEVRDFLKEI
jgi:hypothetical protein